MNFSYILFLAVALFGVFSKAYDMGYDGIFEGGYGGAGYGGAGYGPSVSDTCQCVKTVVRPVVEQIPYVSSRRIHSAGYVGGAGVGAYRGNGIGFGGSGIVGGRSRFFGGGFGGYGRGTGGIIA